MLKGDFSSRDPVCWWHMKDGKVLGGHNGMIIEYDPTTLAPLGMVVSRDELVNRQVGEITLGDGQVLFLGWFISYRCPPAMALMMPSVELRYGFC